MSTESKTTGLDHLVSTLERVLEKFNEIDRKMATLHEELDYVMEELVVSKAEIRQTCETIKNLDTTQVQGKDLEEKVSSTFENLFSQMSQIVHAAREGLLVRNSESQESPLPEDYVETNTITEEPAPETRKPETEIPVVEESQPETEMSVAEESQAEAELPCENDSENDLPSMEEVHETLKEVAKTLVEGESHLTEESPQVETAPPTETMESHFEEEQIVKEEEPQASSPLAELNNLLTDTQKEITQELVGSDESEKSETEVDGDVPMASEPPELLKETLSKIGSFAEANDGIPTEDLGQEPEGGAPASEMSELLKNISSSYVAGAPE